MTRQYWVETLGCPKNQVDSDKLVGTLAADGMIRASRVEDADLVVVNTCAFIEDARQESVNTVLALSEAKDELAEIVVTGCMAERYGSELADALPEVTRVAGFGVPVTLGQSRPAGSVAEAGPNRSLPKLDLLELPRPPATAPWAYVKIAEGCDRNCGFCAIPTFRGKQRSRSHQSILAEVEQLDVGEIVLVAQDLAAFGRDQGVGERSIVSLVGEVSERVHWVRLLYLYPSDLGDDLIEAICNTGVPYFDLSLQHVSPKLLRGMRRWGSGEQFLERIEMIRARESHATFRSNFIVGYPGETEADHDQLLRFVEEAEVDWCGFFAYSKEDGTHAAGLDGEVPSGLVMERMAELGELQDGITQAKRDELIGSEIQVLVDIPGQGRSPREAPEIDGVVELPSSLPVGEFFSVVVSEARGPDLIAVPSNVPGGKGG